MEQELEFSEYPLHLGMQAPGAQPKGRDFYHKADFIPSPGLPDGKSKWDVVRSFKAARKSLGLTPTLIQYLEYLVARTEEQDWRPGSCPIVFSSVGSAATFFDVEARQINNYERDLAELGLLTWHDSGNRRRYGQRHKDGSLRYAYGADLSPLIERYEEIVKMAEADRQELAFKSAQAQAIKSWRRVLKDGLRSARSLGIRSKVVEEASDRLENLPKSIPNKWTSIELCSLAMELESMCIAMKAELEPHLQGKTSDQSEENFRHHNTNNTTLYPVGTCNSERTSPAGDEVIPQAEPATAGGIEEESRGRVCSPDSSPGAEASQRSSSGGSTGIQHITFDQVLAVCSRLMLQMITEEAGQGGLSWAALDRAATKAAAYLGVSPALWTSLRAEIGPAAASVCIVITERRITDPVRPVENPGGFVRGMHERARKGKLHLHKSIFGLVKSDQSATASGLT